MRLAILALAVVLAITACAAANPTSLSNVAPIKNTPTGTPPPAATKQGGDTIATAFVITSVPYDDTGTTTGYADNYDEICPYSGSTAPDVVYQYTPATTVLLDIYTCDSSYDTKLFVYENSYTPGAPYACNDDDYTYCAVSNYRSYISSMLAQAGNTYYIVVDGYSGVDYGAYEFHVRSVAPPPPCDPLFCPADAIVNAEPTCYDGYADTYNGGCNDVTTPYSFELFPLNTTICGESGNYTTNTQRDMDWFHFTPTSNVTVNFSLCSDFAGRIWIASGDCATLTVLQSVATLPGYLGTINQVMTSGTQYTLIVSTDGWLSIPCGAKYVASLYEEGFSPVQPTSWSTIKALYR